MGEGISDVVIRLLIQQQGSIVIVIIGGVGWEFNSELIDVNNKPRGLGWEIHELVT